MPSPQDADPTRPRLGGDHQPGLSPLLDRVRARAPGGREPLVEQLAWATYRRMPADRLAELDVEATAEMLIDALAFMDRRHDGELALRLFEPGPELGWSAPGTVVEVNTEDGPFLLTTITEELSEIGLEVGSVIHPVVGVRREADGSIGGILPARQADNRESWIHLELTRRLSDGERNEVAARLRAVLDDARVAMRDFPAMRDRVEEVAFQTRASAGTRYRAEEIDEAISLLDWLLDDHFVLLGYREYHLRDTPAGSAVGVTPGSGLGILREESSSRYAEPVLLTELAEPLRRQLAEGELLVVSRTNRRSTVHRQVRMIYIGLKKVGGDGSIHGEYRFVGLFAQKAFAEPASSIPVLRRKLRQILEREDIVDHSYDERALRMLFEAFPKHELFAAAVDDLRRTLVQLLEIQRSQDVRLLLRSADDGATASVLVAIPRDRFNAHIRRRVQELLVERFETSSVDYHLTMTERDRALLHFVLHRTSGPLPAVDADDLEREVNALTRTWRDALQAEIVAAHGRTEGLRLADEYAARFPAGYAETTSPATAVLDIAELERLGGRRGQGEDADDVDDVAMTLRPDRDSAVPGRANLLRFNLYMRGRGVELSAFLPILESLGLVVVEEIPYRLEAASYGSGAVHIHDFGVRPRAGHVDVVRDGIRLAEAALAIWNGRAEADALNRLVLLARLTWEQVVVLRAYRRYRRQVGTTFTESYLDDALVGNPDVARALVELFEARFDPDLDDEDLADAARRAVVEGCDAVERLDQDRILRGYLGLIDATLRTNHWVRDAGGRPRRWLSLKFDSRQVPGMPKPVPFREVFVSSPHMEGVHLRGGPVARGGLRWSDRIEDFRTEVLGLMKAQVVKNAVIVPTGSKGGFVLKRPPAPDADGGAALRTAVREQYETFIRGLLDVTDNVAATGGLPAGATAAVVPPEGVRRRDGDDPYLVVAADRGTATFSDVANAISREYGFWLGDAFASGGSQGYDHKAMGITARGAWVAVQRHFRELDIDVQTEPVTVVGIGDMSGDVFGNGLLRSASVRLVAAFDHRHVFLDPDPDPAASYAERQRLFALPRSSWHDYDRSLISEGGGVWSRARKSIPLSRQARALLHTDAAELAPAELLRAVLRAPVDLLFAGGIGTFVKATEETSAEVGDRANDGIRIDADEVGARVVGEGGNLAFTQRGRVQYARRGGRINTDAIDNAAGVATSDREVNLKILLDTAVSEGALDGGERNALLDAMTDEVGEQVLRDVYLQAWAISQEAGGSPEGMEAYEALMVDLGGPPTGAPGGQEAATRLDRAVEVLPTTAEMERRRSAGAGLTRPELAVLLAYSKIDLTTRLLAGTLPDEPSLQRALYGYFPRLVVERFGDRLDHHRLRRDLVATVVANDLVNRMGVTYVSRTASELGATAGAVAAAYWAAREVADAEQHWRAIEALDDRIDPRLQLELKAEVDRLVDAFTRSYLRHAGTAPLDAVVSRDRPAFHEMEKAVVQSGTAARGDLRARRERYADLGIEPDLAERLAALSALTLVPDVAAVARDADQPVRQVADMFFRLSEALPMDELGRLLRDADVEGHWERWQRRGLLDDLRELRRTAAARAIQRHPQLLPEEAVDRYLDARHDLLGRVDIVVGMLRDGSPPSLAALAVAIRALREAVS